MAIIKALFGHTSQETAYEVADYPYGFRLRCKIRYWLEQRPKHGFRLVSQTTNPKRGDSWNKPKAGTYSTLAVMYLDEQGHVQVAALHASDGPDRLLKFKAGFPELPEAERLVLQVIEIVSRKYNPVSWAEHEARASLDEHPPLASEQALASAGGGE
jgi:hypothetical protein